MLNIGIVCPVFYSGISGHTSGKDSRTEPDIAIHTVDCFLLTSCCQIKRLSSIQILKICILLLTILTLIFKLPSNLQLVLTLRTSKNKRLFIYSFKHNERHHFANVC